MKKYALMLLFAAFAASCSNLPLVGGSAVPVEEGQLAPEDGYVADARVSFVKKGDEIPFKGVFYTRMPKNVEVDSQEESTDVSVTPQK